MSRHREAWARWDLEESCNTHERSDHGPGTTCSSMSRHKNLNSVKHLRERSGVVLPGQTISCFTAKEGTGVVPHLQMMDSTFNSCPGLVVFAFVSFGAESFHSNRKNMRIGIDPQSENVLRDANLEPMRARAQAYGILPPCPLFCLSIHFFKASRFRA